MNNLYGYAQMQPLPARAYRWLSRKEIETFDVMTAQDDAKKGYVLEVDLSYPAHLHEAHASLPLAPESLNICYEDLSPYSKDCLRATNPAKVDKYVATKLCGTFLPKKKYLVHYRNLKYYLKKGLVLEKVHRIIEFEQEPFIAPYIERMAKKRAETTSAFKKRLAKLFANSVYGKLLQNIRKYIDVKIVRKGRLTEKYLNSPRFISFKILNSQYVAIFMQKEKVLLDKKYSAGFSVLEMSKLAMFECYYDNIVPALGQENGSIVLSDTDSMILHISGRPKRETTDNRIFGRNRSQPIPIPNRYRYRKSQDFKLLFISKY